MYIEWTSKFETGIERIDKQHKNLVDILNKLYEEIVIKKESFAVNEILMDLKIYTINHFITEEKMLKKYKFPEEENHKAEHDNFKQKISDNLFDVNTSRLEQGYELITFLKDWLLNHILIEDMKYAEYLKKHENFPSSLKSNIG